MLFRPVFIFVGRGFGPAGRASARRAVLKIFSSEPNRAPGHHQPWRSYCTTIVTVLDCAVAPVSAFVAVTTTGTALPGVTPCGSCTFT